MNYKLSKRTEIMHSKGKRGSNFTKPVDEMFQAIKELSAPARTLLDIYYAVNSGWNFNDKHMAEVLGVTVRRFKEIRKELIDKEYLYIAKGPEVDNYYVGKSAVRVIICKRINIEEEVIVK